MPDLVALDTETFLISDDDPAPLVVCVSWAARVDGELASGLLHHSEVEPYLADLLSDPDVRIVGHNWAFDASGIARSWPRLAGLLWQGYDTNKFSDTLIREKLSDLARGRFRGFTTDKGVFVPLKYDLGAVARRRAKYDVDKADPWRLRYGELYDVPLADWPEDARQYAERDAIATLLAYEGQATLAEQWGEVLHFDELPQVRAAWWLRVCSVHGIKTSPEAVELLRRTAEKQIAFLEGDLAEEGLVVRGSKKMAPIRARVERAYLDTGRKVRLTDKGAVCTDRDACLESGDPVLEALVDYNSAKKTLSTECKAYSVPVVHTSFDSLAATGRTTSSRPNIQNVRWNFRDLCPACGCGRARDGLCVLCGTQLEQPPGMRECFVPRPGFVFGSADYSGLELATLAQVCYSVLGHSRLREVLLSGADPHLMVAANILGRPYDTLDKHNPAVKLARQTAKVANFGFPGGLGPPKLVLFARMSYRVRMTEAEAKQLKRIWLETYPEFASYFAYIGSLVQPDGTYTVEHLFSGRVRAGVHFTVACNSLFQGLGSDATKAAGYLIARACYTGLDEQDRPSPLAGCRMVNYIHDEFILEVPDDERADPAARELSRLMVVGAKPYLPDLPIDAEPQLMRYWSKKAEPLFDQAGRLIPWPDRTT